MKRGKSDRMLAEEVRKFHKLFQAWMTKQGGVPERSVIGFCGQLNTRLGPLYVSVHGDDPHVFCRFLGDPKVVAKSIDCNQFSGKWNHYCFTRMSAHAWMTEVTHILGKVLVDPATMTLAEHAEAWGRERNEQVPPRGSPEWKEFYTRYVQFATETL